MIVSMRSLELDHVSSHIPLGNQLAITGFAGSVNFPLPGATSAARNAHFIHWKLRS
jgi:hypothetical protein